MSGDCSVPLICDDNVCAHIGIELSFVGPKKRGEIYEVLLNYNSQLTEKLGIPPFELDPDTPAIYAFWYEKPVCADESYFPEYLSTSVTGTGTITSKSPFKAEFDVEFNNDAGDMRQVKGVFEITDAYYECYAD